VCIVQSIKSKAGSSLKPLAPQLTMYYGAKAGFSLKPLKPQLTMYYDVNGMGAIMQSWAASAASNGLVEDLHQDVWVSPSNGVMHLHPL
jgi:hypothetical protein